MILNCYTVSPGSSMAFSLDVLVSLLRQENAMDICVIKIPENIQYADYLVVVSGISTRHLRAMALYATKVVRNYIVQLFNPPYADWCCFCNCETHCFFLQYKYFKKEKEPNVKIEGKDAEDWMCIDFGMWILGSLHECQFCKSNLGLVHRS